MWLWVSQSRERVSSSSVDPVSVHDLSRRCGSNDERTVPELFLSMSSMIDFQVHSTVSCMIRI